MKVSKEDGGEKGLSGNAISIFGGLNMATRGLSAAKVGEEGGEWQRQRSACGQKVHVNISIVRLHGFFFCFNSLISLIESSFNASDFDF